MAALAFRNNILEQSKLLKRIEWTTDQLAGWTLLTAELTHYLALHNNQHNFWAREAVLARQY